MVDRRVFMHRHCQLLIRSLWFFRLELSLRFQRGAEASLPRRPPAVLRSGPALWESGAMARDGCMEGR